MRILVTGASGNLGSHAVSELASRGHQVRAFDLRTRRTERVARRHGAAVERVWADLREPAEVARAVEGQDAVVHLAFVLPPASERRPEAAHAVNVVGTRSLVSAMEALSAPPRLVLASSYAVHGDTRGDEGLLTAESPLRPMNCYTRHKVTVEQVARESSLSSCILRFGVVLSAESVLSGTIDPLIFDLPTDAKQEFLHSEDAALAIASCVASDEVWGRTLLVGGGERCRLRYHDLINDSLKTLGIGPLPAEPFSRAARQGGGWMDTTESQRLLRYQRWSWDDHLADLARRAGYRRWLCRLAAPAIRWHLVRQSPYLKRGTTR